MINGARSHAQFIDLKTGHRRTTATIRVLPDTRHRAPGWPLAHPEPCSERGPSSPPDSPQQPIIAQKQRLKVIKYSTGWGKIQPLTLIPKFAILGLKHSSIEGSIYSSVIYWTKMTWQWRNFYIRRQDERAKSTDKGPRLNLVTLSVSVLKFVTKASFALSLLTLKITASIYRFALPM